MTPEGTLALDVIRECLDADRFRLTLHFRQRMTQRGFVWLDVLVVVEEPDDVVDDGVDDQGRPKWKLIGEATNGLRVEIVCVLDVDENGSQTVFFTLYYEE